MLLAAVALGFGQKARDHAPAQIASMIGDASYALYLLHPFAIRAFRMILEASGLGTYLAPWSFVALSLCCTLGLSLLVFVAVERPLTRIVRGVLDPPSRSPTRPDGS